MGSQKQQKQTARNFATFPAASQNGKSTQNTPNISLNNM